MGWGGGGKTLVLPLFFLTLILFISFSVGDNQDPEKEEEGENVEHKSLLSIFFPPIAWLESFFASWKGYTKSAFFFEEEKTEEQPIEYVGNVLITFVIGNREDEARLNLSDSYTHFIVPLHSNSPAYDKETSLSVCAPLAFRGGSFPCPRGNPSFFYLGQCFALRDWLRQCLPDNVPMGVRILSAYEDSESLLIYLLKLQFFNPFRALIYRDPPPRQLIDENEEEKTEGGDGEEKEKEGGGLVGGVLQLVRRRTPSLAWRGVVVSDFVDALPDLLIYREKVNTTANDLKSWLENECSSHLNEPAIPNRFEAKLRYFPLPEEPPSPPPAPSSPTPPPTPFQQLKLAKIIEQQKLRDSDWQREKDSEMEREKRRRREEEKGLTSLVLIMQVHNTEFISDGIVSSVTKSFDGLNPMIVATVTTEEGKRKLLELLPDAHVFLWKKNVGMDVAAFMWCVDYLLTFHLDELASDAVVLKWHSKTLQTWRDSLSDPFSSKFEARKSLNAFRYNPTLGMLGSGVMCLKPNNMAKMNFAIATSQGREEVHFLRNFIMLTNLTEFDLGPMIRELEVQSFGRPSSHLERHYVAGTIFFVRFDVLKKIREGMGNKWDHLIQTAPQGHVVKSYMHAMERFLGYAVRMLGYEVNCSRDRFRLSWFFGSRNTGARGSLRVIAARNRAQRLSLPERKPRGQHVF